MRVDVDTKVRTPPHSVTRVLDGIAETILIVALLGELLAVVVNVVARFTLGVSFLWTEEVARIALSTLTFVGGTLAYRRGDHTCVRAVIDTLPPRVRRTCLSLADALVLLVALVALLSSFKVLALNFTRVKMLRGGLEGWKAKGYPVERYDKAFRLDTEGVK